MMEAHCSDISQSVSQVGQRGTSRVSLTHLLAPGSSIARVKVLIDEVLESIKEI